MKKESRLIVELEASQRVFEFHPTLSLGFVTTWVFFLTSLQFDFLSFHPTKFHIFSLSENDHSTIYFFFLIYVFFFTQKFVIKKLLGHGLVLLDNLLRLP